MSKSGKVIAYDSLGVPTGGLIDVTGTPLDFRVPEKIGARIDDSVGGPPGD